MLWEEWDALVFLAMPMIETLKELELLGLKIHDLSMMDSSRQLLTMRHQRRVQITDPLMVQEAKVSSKLEILNDEVKAYKMRRMALLEEAIPKWIMKSTENLTQIFVSFSFSQLFYHFHVSFLLQSSTRAASVCCTLTIARSVKTVVDCKELMLMLNTIYRKFDAVLAEFSVCKLLASINNYQFVVGIPFNSSLVANMAVLIAERLLDVAKLGSTEATTVRNQDSGKKSNYKNLIISDIQIAIDLGAINASIMVVTIPRFAAIGKPVLNSQQIAQIAIVSFFSNQNFQ